eukprot:5135752-Amphidinium_carterae.1
MDERKPVETDDDDTLLRDVVVYVALDPEQIPANAKHIAGSFTVSGVVGDTSIVGELNESCSTHLP